MLQLKFFHDPWCCMVAPPGRSRCTLIPSSTIRLCSDGTPD
uniref:Uncharacterized protein n=1 Tax=Parascaris equorum TaxID=6256 RepID=A0A914RGC3_PAREQ